MLTVTGLSCVRGPRVLFRDLSFRADAGSFLQITGPNGSGKTTLLRTLAGLSRAEAGTLEWDGAGEFAHARAYLGHAPGWKDTLSAAQNLELAWRLDGEVVAGDAGARNAALERAALTRQRNLPVARLSQGQRKRLHLARLTRSTRPLWLLDEPSSALDAAGQRFLAELLGEHLAAGGIALVATHEPIAIAAADAMAQRIELAG